MERTLPSRNPSRSSRTASRNTNHLARGWHQVAAWLLSRSSITETQRARVAGSRVPGMDPCEEKFWIYLLEPFRCLALRQTIPSTALRAASHNGLSRPGHAYLEALSRYISMEIHGHGQRTNHRGPQAPYFQPHMQHPIVLSRRTQARVRSFCAVLATLSSDRDTLVYFHVDRPTEGSATGTVNRALKSWPGQCFQ